MTRRRRTVAAVLAAATLLAACSNGPDGAPGTAGPDAPAPSAVETTSPPRFDPQEPADGPADLARRVTDAEDAVRRSATPGEQVRAAAFELQVLYRQLGRRGGWHDRVVAAVPPRHRDTVRAHITARTELRSMHSSLSDTLPAWRIVDPAPAAQLRRHYRDAEAEFGVPWEVLAAVNLVETGMGRIRGTSVAGAQGPMQFIPSTWDAFGRGDINDPRDAIMAAARYLAHNGGGSGRIDNALFRYNNHPAYVAAVKAWASIMTEDARAFRGFYHWRIIYLSEVGDVWLPVGYDRADPVPVRRYLRENPGHRLSTATS
ncbi:transglycosylase SLT domain-containing protein [Nocardioides panacisoli]|uniref:lytic transglycosylase domain-containing protein n=1 Tax=Nocardioides panacisoli TaxID=627624 RepID=UPI001C628B4C|nr:transglycosylase SLT domain-containing protein [Nocardioides panacisoli]QYJ05607.1 transglycosylase SLT domain-containing protein [Nocardioides panacisoli]